MILNGMTNVIKPLKIKKYFYSSPLLSVPRVGKMLFVYLGIAGLALSAMLMRLECKIPKIPGRPGS